LLGGINTYTYVRDNPLRYTDPSGLNPIAGAIEGGEVGTAICGPYCGVAGALIGGYGGLAASDYIYNAANQSPEINPDDLKDKTENEIKQLANDKGLVQDSKKSCKFRDPVTGKERLRIDPGHIDKVTGQPYNNPNAAQPHVHGYDENGGKIVDPTTNDPHFPLN